MYQVIDKYTRATAGTYQTAARAREACNLLNGGLLRSFIVKKVAP